MNFYRFDDLHFDNTFDNTSHNTDIIRIVIFNSIYIDSCLDICLIRIYTSEYTQKHTYIYIYIYISRILSLSKIQQSSHACYNTARKSALFTRKVSYVTVEACALRSIDGRIGGGG